DSAGKSTYQSVNLQGKGPSNFYLSSYFGRKIGQSDLRLYFGLNVNGNTYYNLINNVMNKTRSYGYSGSISASIYKQKKYNINLSAEPGYNISESSLQKQFNNNGWLVNSRASFSVTLPGKVEIASDANYEFRQKTQSFNQDFDRLILNSSISKKLLKDENLRISFSGNDLMNQNIGFNRSAYNNIITQNQYTTIQRYYMFSIIWDFNKMGGAPSK